MKALVVLAHPDKNSFNYEIFRRVLNALKNEGVELLVHDLYEEDFNPVFTRQDLDQRQEDIIPYINNLLATDVIIVIHPNWWGQPPAILKGWVDRVFREGEIYTVNKGKMEGKLLNKKALIINTSNVSNEIDRELFGEPIFRFWKYNVFQPSGINEIKRINFDQIIISSDEQRKAWLDTIDEQIIALIK